MEQKKLPSLLVHKIVYLDYLTSVLDSIRMADETGRDPKEILQLNIEIGNAMNLRALQDALAHTVFDSPWEGPAAFALSRQLTFHLHKMVRVVENNDVAEMIKKWHLDVVREQGAAMLASRITIPGIVMFDHHLRRLLPPLFHRTGAYASAVKNFKREE